MSQKENSMSKGVTRRQFLKGAGAGALTISLGTSVTCKKSEEKGPAVTTAAPTTTKTPSGGPYNILFILVDQVFLFVSAISRECKSRLDS